MKKVVLFPLLFVTLFMSPKNGVAYDYLVNKSSLELQFGRLTNTENQALSNSNGLVRVKIDIPLDCKVVMNDCEHSQGYTEYTEDDFVIYRIAPKFTCEPIKYWKFRETEEKDFHFTTDDKGNMIFNDRINYQRGGRIRLWEGEVFNDDDHNQKLYDCAKGLIKVSASIIYYGRVKTENYRLVNPLVTNLPLEDLSFEVFSNKTYAFEQKNYKSVAYHERIWAIKLNPVIDTKDYNARVPKVKRALLCE